LLQCAIRLHEEVAEGLALLAQNQQGLPFGSPSLGRDPTSSGSRARRAHSGIPSSA